MGPVLTLQPRRVERRILSGGNMTVDRVTRTSAARPYSTSDIILDGLFTGMIGALAVALWFFILDSIGGHPLYTPALLGTVLLHGGAAAAQGITVAPLEVAAYT